MSRHWAHTRTGLWTCTVALLLAACGGGGGGSAPTPVQPPVSQLPDPPVRVSAASPFVTNCDGTGNSAGLYVNAEVEPSIAVNPRDSANLIGVWQQDRWAGGSARGIVAGASFDGGATWQRQTLPISRCAGATFARVSDPWVTIGADGTAHVVSLATTGGVFESGSANAILTNRSIDGGRSWSAPAALISDGETFFNDKCSITADPTDARYVFAVWDRLVAASNAGPSYGARSTNGGQSWEPARSIYDAGPLGQTVNNQVVVLPNGTLINFFTQIDVGINQPLSSTINIVRSTDKGATWSPPIRISDVLSVGTVDPETHVGVRDASGLGSIAVSPQGTLNVVWQDARSTAGVRDVILLSRSTDAGVTWSTPLRINADPGVQAFTPTIAVRADGMLGVTYYDFRSNTVDPATLLTDYWLIRSSDGINWRESRVAGPFDLSIAPNANGLFLGDYQALATIGNVFVPFFAQTNTAEVNNRTDIFAVVARNASAAAADGGLKQRASPTPAKAVADYKAELIPASAVKAETRRAASDGIARAMERRIPGWGARSGTRLPPGLPAP